MSFQQSLNMDAALPLASADFVVMDTETTGLDVASDRIIEFGAVRVSRGQIQTRDTFDKLVHPGIPVPSTATAIHGLDDSDIKQAPAFPQAIADLTTWTKDSIVMGYALGFDLALLRAEHARHSLTWTAPVSLDIRHLVRIVAPELPSDDLEVVANWLDVTSGRRHRALGDAETAAEIFLALLPKLREKGITTVAQARRACRQKPAVAAGEAASGWHDILQDAPQGKNETPLAAPINSYAYRHRVADIMATTPQMINSDAPISQALTRMMSAQVSSLFVKPGNENPDHGIVTERDILRAIDRIGVAALDEPVRTSATYPLVAIPADEFVYRAIVKMADKGFRHLGVLSNDGAVVGALCTRDLLKQRSAGILSLGDNISRAESAEELGVIWSTLITVVRGLSREAVDARDIAAVISRELRALTRRACQIAELDMERAGKGLAPCAFSLLVLGSGGRGESLLAMDQDNALIYADTPEKSQIDPWFEALGARTARILDDAGVSYCKGGIMASNPAWRMPLAEWRETVGQWLARARPEDILNSDIFFDAASVYGDRTLSKTLDDDTRAAASGATTFLKQLSIRASDFSTPLGLFGRFKLANGRADLKLGGIMPIFSTARVLALQNGIIGRSTPERLQKIAESDPNKADTIDRLLEAHRILLGAILHQQLLDIAEGRALSNSVDPNQLAAHQRDDLKWALQQVSLVSGLLDVPVV